MNVKINTVDNAGNITDTRTETFSYALALTENYASKSVDGVKLLDEHDINQGWTVDVMSWQGNVTTYDFQPVID